MKTNNWEQYNIVMSLQDPFNYVEYLNVCKTKGVIPKNILSYGQKVGLLLLAVKLYPDITPQDAYDKIFLEHSEKIEFTPNKEIIKEIKTTPCGTCGGGIIK